MNATNKLIVANFIEEIWNQGQFEKLDNYLAEEFIDHSLPPTMPPDKEGMKLWIIGTGRSFEHKTVIDDMVCEGDKVILKIRMQLKHIGVWRGFEPTLSEVSTVGFRYYKLKDGKIVDHWGLLDDHPIKNKLKEASLSSNIQQ